jgi:hypothetical protein
VSKGPFAYLDVMFDGTNPAAYTEALTRLEGSLKAAAEARFGTSHPRVTHFQNDWLTSNHWNNLFPEETLKAGLKRAITTARGDDPLHPKPMEFFWVCAREHDFHVYYCEGLRQVTVIIFTPPPLVAEDGAPSGATVGANTLTTKEPIWVVKKKENYEATATGYPGLISTLATIAGPPAATIIERQIYHD